ncbi:hypothetical protein [uncultured Subdoligranulum sp.]|uniref:hypothetical protein n=1 Tax=uncultured Subdoligranulum sp. TaxID=512298 RepID=UPI0025D55C46|nr:hypothetical protein [uncultured Subdoligranulum sp.]
MLKTIRFAALALPALLLAGCAANPLRPAEHTATVETAATPQPQTLNVYATDALLPALQDYATTQEVTLNVTEDPAAADLLALDYKPDGLVEGVDVMSDTLLAAAASRAGITESTDALPLGRSLYGYWANGTMLTSLLGDDAVTALQNASWEEWSDFVETLQAWLEEPEAATVTLNGSDYTLPETKPDTLNATGVFSEPMDRAAGYTAALLAAGSELTEDTLTGPLNGVYSAVTLEWDNLAESDETALFRRAKLTDLLSAYGAEACQSLVLIPFKCNLEESDLSTEEYNLTGLLNYPVLADVGYVTVRAGTDETAQKAAKSAALWLYSSGDGESALTETLGVITPWNTASDTTTLGAMQIEQAGTGILPGSTFTQAQADALAENEESLRGSENHTSAERKTFTTQALTALGVTEAEE